MLTFLVSLFIVLIFTLNKIMLEKVICGFAFSLARCRILYFIFVSKIKLQTFLNVHSLNFNIFLTPIVVLPFNETFFPENTANFFYNVRCVNFATFLSSCQTLNTKHLQKS